MASVYSYQIVQWGKLSQWGHKNMKPCKYKEQKYCEYHHYYISNFYAHQNMDANPIWPNPTILVGLSHFAIDSTKCGYIS